MNSPSLWSCLESIPGLIALLRVWRARLAQNFDSFKALALEEKTSAPAELLPCPRGCGLAHEISRCPDGSFVATCHGDPARPQQLRLSLPDITPLEVSWSKLGRALCRAFELNPQTAAAFNIPNTRQIGSWSAAAIPVILSLQTQPSHLRFAIAQLTNLLHTPFILLLPTHHLLDAFSQAFLNQAGALHLDLASHVVLGAQGTLQPTAPPTELFAQFSKPSSRPSSPSSPSTINHQPSTNRYSLLKDLGFWKLTFDGTHVTLKHHQGTCYVAHLLKNPRDPIHGSRLFAQYPPPNAEKSGPTEIIHPETGEAVTVSTDSQLQQVPLAVDDEEVLGSLRKLQRKLKTDLSSKKTDSSDKPHIRKQLRQIAAFLRKRSRRPLNPDEKAAKAVHRAISRFLDSLLKPLGPKAQPHPVLSCFAGHLEKHLVIPSSRYSRRYLRGKTARKGLAGCFIYEPPPDITWT